MYSTNNYLIWAWLILIAVHDYGQSTLWLKFGSSKRILLKFFRWERQKDNVVWGIISAGINWISHDTSGGELQRNWISRWRGLKLSIYSFRQDISIRSSCKYLCIIGKALTQIQVWLVLATAVMRATCTVPKPKMAQCSPSYCNQRNLIRNHFEQPSEFQ